MSAVVVTRRDSKEPFGRPETPFGSSAPENRDGALEEPAATAAPARERDTQPTAQPDTQPNEAKSAADRPASEPPASEPPASEPPIDDLNEAFARAAEVVRARERQGLPIGPTALEDSDADDKVGNPGKHNDAGPGDDATRGDDEQDGHSADGAAGPLAPAAAEASDARGAEKARGDDESVPVFEDSRPLVDSATLLAPKRRPQPREASQVDNRAEGDAPASAAREGGGRSAFESARGAQNERNANAEHSPPAADKTAAPTSAAAPPVSRQRTEDLIRRAPTAAGTASTAVSPSRRPRRPTNPPTPDERAADALAVHRRRRTPRYRSLLWRWFSSWFRRPETAVFAPLPPVEPGQLSVSFAGHASALVRYHNLAIACDPMLGKWHKGIRRRQQPGLSPAEFADVELILLSHADPAHMHRDTLAKLPRSATIVLPPATARYVSDLGFARVIELGVGQSLQLRQVHIRTTASRHTGERGSKALSYVVRGEGPSVFFCGDSGYFSGFAEIGRRYQPDVALLPISGYAPRSFRDRHMSPLDALNAFEDLQARALVPIRFGAFALSYEQLHDPARWLAELIRERDLDPYVAPLEPGASRIFTLPPGERRRARRPSTRG